jgi:hypothetical protein
MGFHANHLEIVLHIVNYTINEFSNVLFTLFRVIERHLRHISFYLIGNGLLNDGTLTLSSIYTYVWKLKLNANR